MTVLPASEVARAAGLTLHRKGSREWACCPIHREKTPSMCFFPDGHFHCFGCGAHGDAADLHRTLHGGTLAEALRAVGKEPQARTLSPGEQLRRRVEAHKAAAYDDACADYHMAVATLCAVEGLHETPQEAADDPMLWQAVALREQAARRLDDLDGLTASELMNDLLAEGRTNGRLEPTRSDASRTSAPAHGMANVISPASAAGA